MSWKQKNCWIWWNTPKLCTYFLKWKKKSYAHIFCCFLSFVIAPFNLLLAVNRASPRPMQSMPLLWDPHLGVPPPNSAGLWWDRKGLKTIFALNSNNFVASTWTTHACRLQAIDSILQMSTPKQLGFCTLPLRSCKAALHCLAAFWLHLLFFFFMF